MRRAGSGLCGGTVRRAVRRGYASGCPAGLFTQHVTNRIPLAYALLARLSRLTVERMWRGTA